MPNITIRDVAPDVHRTLVKRAARRGQSLQHYLAELLVQHTSVLSMDEWLEDLDEMHRAWGPQVDTDWDDAAYLRAAHEERGARLSGL